MNGPIGYELSPLAEEASQLVNDLGLHPGDVRANRLLQIIEVMDVEIASRGIASHNVRELLKKLVHDDYDASTVDVFSKALEEARALFKK